MKFFLCLIVFSFISISYSQKSIEFDSNQKDFIEIKENTFIDFLDQSFSIETVLIPVKSNQKEEQVILHYYNKDYSEGFILSLMDGAHISFQLNNELYLVRKLELREDKCYQISITFDKGKLLIYVNGDVVLESEYKDEIEKLKYDIPFYIGGFSENYNFNGIIDEVRLFNSAVTSVDIVESLFKACNISQISEMEAYYSFDEDFYQIIRDHAQNNNGYFSYTNEEEIQDPKRIDAKCVTQFHISEEISYCDIIKYNTQPFHNCLNPNHFDENDNHLESFFVYDRFGNIYCESTISRMNGLNYRSQESVEQVGHFELIYDDIITDDYKAIINQVFFDFDNFLVFNSSCNQGDLIKIEISAQPLGSSVLAEAGSYSDDLSNTTGVTRGRVWQGVNAGSYTNSSLNPTALININKNRIDANDFYLGYTSDDDSDGFVDQLDAVNLYDLYGVIQHEVIHVLGFSSWLKADGQGVDSTISAYDLLLSQNAQFFVNELVPFGWNGNLIPEDVLNNNNCSITYLEGHYATGQIPVLLTTDTQGNYNNSNLSHINDDCFSSNLTHLMSPTVARGAYERLTQEEVDVLHDLKYQTNANYGSTLINGSFNPNSRNYSVVENRPSIAINDPCESSFIIDGCNSNSFTYEELGILSNDISSSSFNPEIIDVFLLEPSELLNNEYISFSLNDDGITLVSNGYFYSPFFLGYKISSPDSQISNIGTIKFETQPCEDFNINLGCLEDEFNSCNLICNSLLECEFGAVCNQGYSGINPLNSVWGWYPLSGTPDYLENNSFNLRLNESVITTASIDQNKNYILSCFLKSKSAGETSQLDIIASNLEDVNYPEVLESPLFLGDTQVLANIQVASGDYEEFIVCFSANNNFDILTFLQPLNLQTRLSQVEMIEDKLFNEDVFSTEYVGQCEDGTLVGADLCTLSGMEYEWFKMVDGLEKQLTNGNSTLTDTGQSLGITIINPSGSLIKVPNEDGTYIIKRRFISTNGFPVNGACEVEVEVSVISNGEDCVELPCENACVQSGIWPVIGDDIANANSIIFANHNANTIGSDCEGNVYSVGLWNGGGSSPSLVKYDKYGVFVWEVDIENAKRIKTDDNLNVYLQGTDFISKFNSNGVLLWKQSIEIDNDYRVSFIELDTANSDIYFSIINVYDWDNNGDINVNFNEVITSQTFVETVDFNTSAIIKISSNGIVSNLDTIVNGKINDLHFIDGKLHAFIEYNNQLTFAVSNTNSLAPDTQNWYLHAQYVNSNLIYSQNILAVVDEITNYVHMPIFYYNHINETIFFVKINHFVSPHNITEIALDGTILNSNQISDGASTKFSEDNTFYNELNGAIFVFFDSNLNNVDFYATVFEFNDGVLSSKPLTNNIQESMRSLYNRSNKSITITGECIYISSAYHKAYDDLALNDGVVLPAIEGNGNGKQYALRLQSDLTIARPSATQTTEDELWKIKVFPNPVKDEVNIVINSEQIDKVSKIEVLNIIGEKIYQVPPYLLKKNNIIIGLQNENSGLYIIRVTTIHGQTISQKFIKK